MRRIAVFFSGNGTDFQSLIDGQNMSKFDGRIVVAISSSPDAYGIQRAKKAGIDCYVYQKSDYADAAARDAAVAETLHRYDVDMIVLAGYLGILTDKLLGVFDDIINIHPSLLPKFGGKGMYGINVHKAVIAAGEKKSGATVHYVADGIDQGEIIMQRETDVLPTDTPESLQQRILDTIEHTLLVEAVAMLCAKRA